MNISEQIFSSGTVGCGGAGFPTHVKLRGEAGHLIVNGAECEPLLCTDRYIMRRFAAEIVSAAAALSAELGADCTIALKRGCGDEISALSRAIETAHAQVKLHLLDSFYPAGDEQTLVFEVTGHAAPPAGLPLDVGCVVINAAIKKRLSESGYRYPKGKGSTPPHPLREYRKLPAARAAARAGVYEYNALSIDELAVAQPDAVRLPLRQSGGAPAEPVVADGQQVYAGQLIARCPEGGLGANLHASIDGRARLEGDSISIVGKGGNA